MANNPYVNKVAVYVSGVGDVPIMDITDTTATEDKVLSGYYFYKANGQRVAGTATAGVTAEALTITQNGTYTAPAGKAYTPVTVNVAGGSVIPSNIQNDGKTYIGIHIPDGSPFTTVKIIVNGTSSSMRATLDWGDGSSTVSLSGSGYKTNTHTYAATGDKIITINATAGTVRIGGGSSYRLYGAGTDALNGVLRTYIQWLIIGNRTQVSGTYGLYYAVGLQEVRFYTSYSSQTSVANYFFNYCYSLRKITFSSYITSLGESAFASCYCLEEIELPSNLTTISASCFANCNMLQHITIPSKVTTIGASAFNNSYAISKIRFEASSPPTVANSNAFTGLPAGCIISVPTGKRSAYTNAANYPSSSTYTYIEE